MEINMNISYIINIIPRLKKFAQHVEIKEALVDKVWVIYGDEDLIEYEFERPSNVLEQSGEITVTKNGNSYDGSWKILGSGRLKIKTDFTNNTLEYDFSVPGILVMKIAGPQNIPFLLFDPKVVENGNIRNYLETLENNDKKISTSPHNIEPIAFDDEYAFYLLYGYFGIVILIAFVLVELKIIR
jgi:hypothetical protein